MFLYWVWKYPVWKHTYMMINSFAKQTLCQLQQFLIITISALIIYATFVFKSSYNDGYAFIFSYIYKSTYYVKIYITTFLMFVSFFPSELTKNNFKNWYYIEISCAFLCKDLQKINYILSCFKQTLSKVLYILK
jgi:hypothetical protein